MDYLIWHFYRAPIAILAIVGNYLYFVDHLFSVPLLIKTLFSPWRRLEEEKKPGLAALWNSFTFSVVSRFIGFFIRLSTLLTALFFFALVSFLGTFNFLLWFLLPIVSFPLYMSFKKVEEQKISSIISGDKDNPNLFENLAKTSASDFLAKRLNIKPNADSYKSVEFEDLLHVAYWYDRLREQEKIKNRFWTRENLTSVPGIGRQWAFGYTPFLDRFTADLSQEPFSIEKLVGRKNQIEAIERVLAKSGYSNVLLVGAPGVGRHTITVGLAKLVQEGKCKEELKYKKVLSLDLYKVLGKDEAESQQRLIDVLEEARKAGNIVLVIPSFDKFVSEGEARINFTEVFSQHIKGEDIQIIGITDPNSYQKYIVHNPTLLKLFEKVEVSEVSEDQALEILENTVPDLEKKSKVLITYSALKEIVRQSKDLITDIPFPEKAIELLEEAAIFAKTKDSPILLKEDVDKILSEKTKLPVGPLKAIEKEKLLNLKEILHKRVIGQDQALEKISQALRRKRTQVEEEAKPIGTFLFLGPTGVGKTETAKALAEAYFGDEKSMVRLDMALFQGGQDVEKLVGGDVQVGLLTSQIRQNPFCVLLLDEFEKANPKILNLFLTVFDEAYIQDGQGAKVSFRNCIIIATSNAGSEFIRENIEKDSLEKELLEYLLKERIFAPELLNRFDSVLFFKPLTQSELLQIAKIKISKLNERLKEEKGITIKVGEEDIIKLVKKGFDPTFGARNLERTIQEEIENFIANKLLGEDLKKGSEITVSL